MAANIQNKRPCVPVLSKLSKADEAGYPFLLFTAGASSASCAGRLAFCFCDFSLFFFGSGFIEDATAAQASNASCFISILLIATSSGIGLIIEDLTSTSNALNASCFIRALATFSSCDIKSISSCSSFFNWSASATLPAGRGCCPCGCYGCCACGCFCSCSSHDMRLHAAAGRFMAGRFKVCRVGAIL